MMTYHRHYPSEEVQRRIDVEDDLYSDVHVCFWEGKHCEEWANQVCRKRGVDASEVDLRGFRATDGIALQSLSRQGFCAVVGVQYGAMFWKELRSYRAMQKHRCEKCVDMEDMRGMTSLSNNSRVGIQEMASDLSCQSHVTSRSLQNSPSPHHLYQEYVMSYQDRMSPSPYEVRSRYRPEHSPPMSYEGSISPGYQDRIPSHEVYVQPHLPPTPESYSSQSQSPQLIYPDHAIPPPRKPLPELLPLNIEEEEEENDVQSTAHRHSNNVYYTQIPSYNSTHQDVIIHPSTHRPVHIIEGHDGTRIIRYIQQLPTPPPPPAPPSHPHHRHHPNHVPHPIMNRGNSGHHNNHPSAINYESDGEDDEESHGENGGRLVIDLREDGTEENGTEMDRGSLSPANPFEHLKKIPTKRKRDRGPKSWEFLMRLLASPQTNPSIIRWEDEAEGSFRLVQPQEIANMWGTRSNKDDLSYNNFARALRYHYKTKLLYKISERQLVYGCGPVAINFYRQLLNQENKLPLGGSTG